MKRIISGMIISILLITTSFAYNPSQRDASLLQKVYQRIDIIHQKAPEKITVLDAALTQLQNKYKEKERLSYLLLEMKLYLDTLPEQENKTEQEKVEYKTEIKIRDEDDNTYFIVEGSTVYMNGTINEETPDLVYKIFKNHDIEQIIMQEVGGSSDDEANLEVSRWIAKQKITILLEDDSDIASGGVEFYLSGANRIMYDGAKVGIHSWASDDGTVAADYPKGHWEHDRYIDYYIDLGFSKKWSTDFYYLTIQAAPADDMYYMKNSEIEKYGILTEKIRK